MRLNAAMLTLLLAGAPAVPGADVLVVPPDRLPPRPPPPPADPDEVQRLATEGSEDEVWRYRYDHTLTEAQTGALLDRLDRLYLARHQAAEEAARERRATERAKRKGARLAAWEADPLSVRCPKCRAGKGKRCQGANATMPQPHPERVRAMERQAKVPT